MSVADTRSAQLILWADTAPPIVKIKCERTDGLLRVHNVWDSGQGHGRWESLMATSGMLMEVDPTGRRVYRCNDIGLDPDFTKLVFAIRIE